MTEITSFLNQYGYAVIFIWVLADQAALPLPSLPVLITAGALATAGNLNLALVVLTAAMACLISDTAWYYLGRRLGFKTLGIVCKLSLEPHTCVTRTKSSFNDRGPMSLIFAKYVPGLQTLAPAIAGALQVPWKVFFAFDLFGTLLWVVPFALVGYLFHDQLATLLTALTDLAGGAIWVVLIVTSVYASFKAIEWVLFLREMRVRRIDVESLQRRMQDATPMTLIDLRQRLDFSFLPRVIPGAIRIPIDEIPQRHEEIPRDQDIVLYCT